MGLRFKIVISRINGKRIRSYPGDVTIHHILVPQPGVFISDRVGRLLRQFGLRHARYLYKLAHEPGAQDLVLLASALPVE